ncbi:MAG: PBP1A family penicillin-binding protein [Gemmatimonadales bacterium]|nr:PBP1A family penicillin-binding protein [Gemmatimonadota bacterium]MCL4215168.1 PBP1A family penicillin-binding protein [Gemmatimonadales bacterium]
MRRKLLYSALGLTGLGLLGLVSFAVYWTWFVCAGDVCPSLEQFDEYRPDQPARLYAADGRYFAEVGAEGRTVVRLEQIPQHVIDAFVITEDKRFYRHAGIDYIRILGAVWANIKAGGFAEGFSTITMQLARNIFSEQLSPEKTLLRKVREAKVARQIESRFSKERILELYLNQIAFGTGAFGVESAAQRYFGRPINEMTVAEGAMLAALPKAPSRYNPRRFPDRAIQRRNTVIELMRRENALSDADASIAKAYPLRLFRPARGGTGEIAPYFVEWVRTELVRRFGRQAYEQGLRVMTSLDLDMQGAAERAMERQIRAVEAMSDFEYQTYEQYMARGQGGNADPNRANSPYLQGAFVAMDPRTGGVRALVGGRDFDDSQFNRAVIAQRQPGSTFKPIVYSTAIRTGRPASYFIDDEPIEVPQLDGSLWAPQNYDLKFEGRVTMRRALYQSRNLPAIRLTMELGESGVVEMAKSFGLTTKVPPYPSIALGSADVFPIEMIAAYSTFANLGWRVPANPILRVETADGRRLYEAQPERVQVLSREEAWLMVDMMKDVVRRGSGTAVLRGGFTLPTAGKTGTTNDYTDVWYIGYTTDLVAGVWMGFDQPRKIIRDAQGGRLAAPAWTAFMREVYQRKPPSPDWPVPLGIIRMEIDPATGLRAGPGCMSDSVRVEFFLPGTEPQSECPRPFPF